MGNPEFLILWVEVNQHSSQPVGLHYQDKADSWPDAMLKIKELSKDHPTAKFGVMAVYGGKT